MTDTLHPPPVPAVLRLVQGLVAGRWRATGEELYREVARVTEAAAGREILVVGCGDGITPEWLAARTGAHVTGVDPDATRMSRAERRCRESGSHAGVGFEQGAFEDLPHERDVFDAVVAEPSLAAAADVGRAVAELARVTRPMGRVVLLQPTWSTEIRAASRELVAARLGMEPLLVVEWKQLLRDAGIVDIQVQDWTDGGPARRASGQQPVQSPSLAWHQKVQIVGRAWRRWGWREARGALQRETHLLRELGRERALGFHLIHGVKWPHAKPA